jgi:hypothetical protein
MEPVSLAEWLSSGSLGLVAIGVIALVLPFAQANAAYFDPRRCDESARAVPVLLVVGPLLYDARQLPSRFADGARTAAAASREAFRDAAALLILLTTSPKGAMT